jgi:hypothetical protein
VAIDWKGVQGQVVAGVTVAAVIGGGSLIWNTISSGGLARFIHRADWMAWNGGNWACVGVTLLARSGVGFVRREGWRRAGLGWGTLPRRSGRAPDGALGEQ